MCHSAWGQMGTELNSVELQKAIKIELKKIGWSLKRLAREYYIETHDEYECDEEELVRFEEKVKKEFSRSTTKLERLLVYLGFVENHYDYSAINKVKPVYVPSDAIDNECISNMKEVSRYISSELIKN